MCAFDLPTSESRKAFLIKLRENGVMALPCGPVTVRFRPPLTITADEVDEGIEAVEKTARQM
jgi:L-lysine 6-transaminase